MHARPTQLTILLALVPLGALLTALSASAAYADGPGAGPAAGPARIASRAEWPEQLAHRNARYAVLDRVDDPVGDAREAFLASAHVRRIDDPIGDREEERRFLAARRGHWASVYARVSRAVDRAGDAVQAVLATRTLARKDAQFARIRFPRLADPKGDQVFEDQVELAKYQQDRVRFGQLGERVGFAEQREDPEGRFNREERDERRKSASLDRTTEGHRADDAEEARLLREDREDAGREARLDASIDELDERSEAREEARDETKLERLEESGERASERGEERELDSTEERATIQSEEGGGLIQ